MARRRVESVSVSNAIPRAAHADVRRVVAMAAEWALDDGARRLVHVNVKASPSRWTGGTAYYRIPGIANVPPASKRGGCEALYLVTLRMPWRGGEPLMVESGRRVDVRTPRVDPWVFSGPWEEFALVAVHEMVHVAQFDLRDHGDERQRRAPLSEAECNRKAAVAVRSFASRLPSWDRGVAAGRS